VYPFFVFNAFHFFFKSLAQDRGKKAAVAVMSGAGTGGAQGLKDIKEKDGLVVAQSEESASYDGMPRAALGTGLVDMVMPPADMPGEILRYYKHKGAAEGKKRLACLELTEWLNKIFVVLRARTGHDFSFYKSKKIARRIDRRMALNQIKDHEIYIQFLRETPEEIDTLFRELLIGITSLSRTERGIGSGRLSGIV
jgi:two-component system CheB/CheR fusion protein